MGEWAKTLSIGWAMALTSIRGQMQYRVSFLISVLAGMTFQAMGFVFIWAVLAQFESLGGWTITDIGVLYGMRLTAHGLYQTAFSGMFGFDTLVREGGFDRYLLRPLHPVVQLMFGTFRLTTLGDLLGGVLLLVATLPRAEIAWTWHHMVLLIAAIIGGALIDGAFQLAPAALSFRFIESFPARLIFDDIFSRFGNYPLAIFHNPARWLITFIVPVAFMAYLPASALLGKETYLPEWAGWLTPILGVVLFTAALRIFMRASQGYQSSGN